jgi:hypothetical protein
MKLRRSRQMGDDSFVDIDPRRRRIPATFLLADELRQMLDDAIAKDENFDLELVKRGLYVKVVSDDITNVLKLEAWKGASYSWSWGVSLAYVPAKLEKRLVFHRTVKSARLDLWEDGRSVAEREGGNWRDPLTDLISTKRRARKDVKHATTWTLPRAKGWWNSASTLEGVLEIARDQVSREPFVIDEIKWPRPQLIVILTLARLGRVSEAREELARWDWLNREEGLAAAAAIDRVAPG